MSAGRRGRGLELVLLAAAAALFAAGSGWGRSEEFVPARRDADSLRLVTWNVGRELLAGAPALASEHEPHVVQRLELLDADLVVLQEVADEAQARRLADALGERWELAVSGVGARRCVVVLARRAELDRGRLRGVDGRAVFAAVRFRRRGQDPPGLVVAGVHAAAFSSEERNRLLGSVRVQLDAASAGMARVLAGDFNLDVDPQQSRDLFSDDAYLDVQTYNALLEGSGDRPGLVDAGATAGPTAEPDRRLDYLLVDAEAFTVSQAGPWRGQRAPGMDHDPLVADVVPRAGR